jgi:outer membrane lipoprotein-sorting protein
VSARSSRRSAALLHLTLALVCAACVRPIAPPHAAIPEDARRAVALLAERWHAFSDLRTLADIRIERGGERQQLTGVLLARSPASVRLEALSPLGQPLLLATIHEGRLTAYDAASNSALVGPATADTAARLLSLPFDPDDLVGVLAGRPVPPKDLRTAEVLPADGHGPSVALTGAIHHLRVWMDFATGIVRQVEITGGRYAMRVSYLLRDDGRPVGFDLSAAEGYMTGAIRYRDPVYDAGIDVARFSLTLPERAKIEELR